ncbi:MAG: hypothetical protein LIQ31_13235, partial [Planctomycetes bacterium]|nr:hypothetical protein [Planctomycetota bacterium]
KCRFMPAAASGDNADAVLPGSQQRFQDTGIFGFCDKTRVGLGKSFDHLVDHVGRIIEKSLHFFSPEIGWNTS